MNVLSKELEKLLQKESDEEKYQKARTRFLKHYYRLRQKEDKRLFNRLSLEYRRKIHKYILGIYALKNRLGDFSYEVLRDNRADSSSSVIFAITHVGKYDIEVVSEAIKEHYYLLSGDYEHLQGTIDAAFLALNGVFYFNEKVKKDRKAVCDKMIDHLKQGGNLMYFPEGTWNLSPNLPVLPCYWGIIDIARAGGATIVPVAAEQYGKHFVINIGESFNVNLYENNVEGKTIAITDLRDAMATLKWEIWESRPLQPRSELQAGEWEDYIHDRLAEWPYFTEEYIEGMIFRKKPAL